MKQKDQIINIGMSNNKSKTNMPKQNFSFSSWIDSINNLITSNKRKLINR